MKGQSRWSCHLVFDAAGVKRMTRGHPSLRAGEYAIRIFLKLPNNLFVRSLPEATIKVPEAALVRPEVDVIGEIGAVLDSAPAAT
jgi:hypothetical protein